MKDFQDKLGYHFSDISLLENALTHSSYANERRIANNERLEFLGDSVLSIIVSDFLYLRMPKVKEGVLTKLRASLVCEQSLAELSKKFSLSEYIKLGKGEEITGGRGRASIIADAFEAVLAAIYLDGGMNAAHVWLLDIMHDSLEKAMSGEIYQDYKTMLQEAVQKGDTGKVTYNLIKESGPDHMKSFEVSALIDGKTISKGKGTSKKDAEQAAAHAALELIGGQKNEAL
jgi:ribonuclease-3